MVSRTADDLARHHGKLMIDHREPHLLVFDLSQHDTDRILSRGVSGSILRCLQIPGQIVTHAPHMIMNGGR